MSILHSTAIIMTMLLLKCHRISTFSTRSSASAYLKRYLSNALSTSVAGQATDITGKEALFRFGVIADIQYVDSDDATNFQGTRMRRYRHSLGVYNAAVKDWNSQIEMEPTRCNKDNLSPSISSSTSSSSSSSTSNPTFACSIVLGDIIDGKAAALNNQELCYGHFNAIAESSLTDTLYCFGNHCHYSFTREQLVNKFLHKVNDKLPGNALGGECTASKLYYDFSPYPGWRFVCVDSYDVSLIGASSAETRELSQRLLDEHNPNDLTKSGTWFNNLPYHKRRWVPYNGGVSESQLQWLDGVLEKSNEKGEKVIVFAHQPIWAPDKPQSLIWNAEEILSILHKRTNVCLWMAGHDHTGQYDIDSTGIHHLVPPAPIESSPGDKTYGHIDVYADKLRLTWHGERPSRTIKPFPYEMTICL